MDEHKFFLLFRVKLAMVCHVYRFCVNIRKGRQERNGKISFLLCEAEVSRVGIYAENLVQQTFLPY
jgi:hypothetical protein